MPENALDPPSDSMRAALARITKAREGRRPRAAGDDVMAMIEARRTNAAALVRERPLDADMHVETLEVAGRSANWVWTDDAVPERTVLYMHGGAFIAGSAESARYSNGLIARAGRSQLLAIDYRLAPEDPFPAGLEDVVASYQWLLDQGRDPARLALGGTSAGGNLALAALFVLRERRLPLPRAVFTICPLTDFTAAQRGNDRSGGQIADLYIAGHDPADPHLSPALGDLTGLPPLHVEVGTADALVVDNRALVANARAAGGDAALHETLGGIHSFLYLAPESPEATALVRRVGAFLDAQLG